MSMQPPRPPRPGEDDARLEATRPMGDVRPARPASPGPLPGHVVPERFAQGDGPGGPGGGHSAGGHSAGSGGPGRRFLGIAVGIVGLLVVGAIILAVIWGGQASAPAETGSGESQPSASEEQGAGTGDGAPAGEPSSTASSTGVASATPSSTSASATPCEASALAARISGSGQTRTLALENRGRTTCSIDGAPSLEFESAQGRALDVRVSGGATGRPLVLEPGDDARASLRIERPGQGATAERVTIDVGGDRPLEVRANVPVGSGGAVSVEAWD